MALNSFHKYLLSPILTIVLHHNLMHHHHIKNLVLIVKLSSYWLPMPCMHTGCMQQKKQNKTIIHIY